MIKELRRLMEIEGGRFEKTPLPTEFRQLKSLYCRRKPLLKILFRHGQSLLGRLGLGYVKLAVVGLIKRDAVFSDVHEEVAAMRKAVIHFAERVDDEIDWCAQGFVDGKFADKAVVELEPIVDSVGQPLVVDDDEDIKIRAIAFGRVRFVDPAAPCVASIEDDLLDLPFLLPLVLREDQRVFELFEDDRLHAFDLALLDCRKVIEVGAHIDPYRGVLRLHWQVASHNITVIS